MCVRRPFMRKLCALIHACKQSLQCRLTRFSVFCPSLQALKAAGNTAFKKGALEEAIAAYSSAIILEDTAVLRSNRSAAHVGVGNFEEALNDAMTACSRGGAKRTSGRGLHSRVLAGSTRRERRSLPRQTPARATNARWWRAETQLSAGQPGPREAAPPRALLAPQG